MIYIIEDALTHFYGQEEKRSFLVNGSKIIYSSPHFTHYNYMRMNTDKFIMTPGHVMFDRSVINLSNFYNFKERMRFLHDIGCTLFITTIDIPFERQFNCQIKKAKQALINSTIDYVISVKIPLVRLTATFIRKCRKENIPIIFTEITKLSDFSVVPWQLIRGELHQYRIMVIPIWKVDESKRKMKRLETDWLKTLSDNKIPTIVPPPLEHSPLSKQFLLTVGLYPNKGALHAGCDADFLLYFKETLTTSTDFKYIKPKVVVSNGVVKKAGKYINIQPGSGREIIIKMPCRFMPIKNALQDEGLAIDYY